MLVTVKSLPLIVRGALERVKWSRPDVEVKGAATYSYQGSGGRGTHSFCVYGNVRAKEACSTFLAGSWGGPNWSPESKSNLVDSDDSERPLTVGDFALKGTMAETAKWCTLYVGLDDYAALEALPALYTVLADHLDEHGSGEAAVAVYHAHSASKSPFAPDADDLLEKTVMEARVEQIAVSRLTDADRAILATVAHLTSAGRKKQYDEWTCAAPRGKTDVRMRIKDTITSLVERGFLKRSKSGAVSITSLGRRHAPDGRTLYSVKLFP